MRLFVLLLVIPVACATTAVQQGPPNWRGITSDFNIELRGEPPRRQLQMLEEFIHEYPDCPNLSYYLTIFIRRVIALEEPERAEILLMPFWEDPDSERDRKQIGFLLLTLYSQTGEEEKFEGVARELVSFADLHPREYRSIVESAYQAGFWSMILEHADQALDDPFYTFEASQIRTSRPGGAEESVARFRREEAELMVWKGAALIAQSQPREALEILAGAREQDPPNFTGLSMTPYNRHFAEAHIALGQTEEAVRYLAIDALLGNDAGALEDLRELYHQWQGEDADFRRWSVNTRRELGQPVPDFSLPDFDGEEHSFSDMNGKVVIVIFWGYG
ncbi:hypothetical protein ACFL6R_00395 [Gemmatimonadota bacterium]